MPEFLHSGIFSRKANDMSSLSYDSLLDQVLRGNINFSTDTIYVMLVDSTYVPNQGTHIYRSSVTGEVSGTGYTAGGQVVTATLSKDTTNHKNTITFSAVSWANATITAAKAVYYKHRGGASTADELIAVDDFGGNVAATNTTFSLAATTLTLNTPM
jgi:hypothetical protein